MSLTDVFLIFALQGATAAVVLSFLVRKTG
jgi:hypothetical protein